ncbi:Fic family protein [Ewingella americana]|uniref:Cell filamentation protein Fic n=1 Tax=Ewingella americana TaxID=41202 RepID=A0A502GF65_9GAMM|nr:Fic family protein [Ewingella americana]TPG59930.1 cell filamentation protein Fic [Ewingella americana]
MNFQLYPDDLKALRDISSDTSYAFRLARQNHKIMVYNMAKLENVNYTYAEVDMLLDGTTVGNKRLDEQQIILNQDDAWKLLITMLSEKRFDLDKDIFKEFHAVVAFKEALTWGVFRDKQTYVAGTKWTPPPANELTGIFVQGVREIEELHHPIVQAINFFLMGALNQFFFDGNKRTSRLMSSGVLLRAGYPPLDIPASKHQEFNQKMAYFYDTRESKDIGDFLVQIVRELAVR